MGARIEGASAPRDPSSRGRDAPGGARHSVLPDRIETGTYAMAVAMTGGDVLLEGARRTAAGGARRLARPARDHATNDGIRVRRNGGGLAPVDVTTRRSPASRPTCRPSSWR
jgi:UDP-N-acetylglucosamine 1-carboxyvinyltransferase